MTGESETTVKVEQTKKWIVFSIVLVFITGLLAGTLAGIFIGRRTAMPCGGPGFMGEDGPRGRDKMQPGMGPGMAPDKMREGFIAKLTQDLSLNDSQVKDLRKIMEANEKDLTSFRDSMKENMTKMRQKMSAQIKGILNEDQKKKFEEFEKRMEERAGNDFGPPGGPRMGGGFGGPHGGPGEPPPMQDRPGGAPNTGGATSTANP